MFYLLNGMGVITSTAFNVVFLKKFDNVILLSVYVSFYGFHDKY